MSVRKSYKGHSLFTDVAEAETRHYNQSAVLLSMVTRFRQSNNQLSREGIENVLGYLRELDNADRREVIKKVSTALKGEQGGILCAGVRNVEH